MATLASLPEAATILPAPRPNDRANMMALAVRTALYSVFKHKRLVIGVFLVIFLGTAVFAFLRPTLWMATAKILVKLGETVQLAPAEAPSRSIALPIAQEVVKTETDIATSYDVVHNAVQKLIDEKVLAVDADTDRAQLDDAIRLGLIAAPTAASNGLTISFIGKNPDRAAKVVNTVTDLYLKHHADVYKHGGMKDFYAEQLQLLQTQMEEAQSKLRDFLRSSNIVDVDQEIRLLNQDVLEQEKALSTHRAKIGATQKKLTEVQQQQAATPKQIHFSQEFLQNPVLASFKNKLTDLEVQRIGLLEKFEPGDRHVQDVEEQIRNMRARIKQEQERILNKEVVRENEIYDELERNRLSLETLLADANSREPVLASRLDEARARLKELRDKRFTIDNLQQEADQKKYAYDTYFKKKEEARITEEMSDEAMVNVSVMDWAVPPTQSINGVVLPLALGLVGGLLVSVAIAVAMEYLSRRLRFEEEVEHYLELPVLAVVPDLETAPDLAKA
jgi:protein tyrosine kinase modulator